MRAFMDKVEFVEFLKDNDRDMMFTSNKKNDERIMLTKIPVIDNENVVWIYTAHFYEMYDGKYNKREQNIKPIGVFFKKYSQFVIMDYYYLPYYDAFSENIPDSETVDDTTLVKYSKFRDNVSNCLLQFTKEKIKENYDSYQPLTGKEKDYIFKDIRLTILRYGFEAIEEQLSDGINIISCFDGVSDIEMLFENSLQFCATIFERARTKQEDLLSSRIERLKTIEQCVEELKNDKDFTDSFNFYAVLRQLQSNGVKTVSATVVGPDGLHDFEFKVPVEVILRQLPNLGYIIDSNISVADRKAWYKHYKHEPIREKNITTIRFRGKVVWSRE